MSKTSFVIIMSGNDKNVWCGEIHWIEGRKKEIFRSSLEMLTLMNSVVKSSEMDALKPMMQSVNGALYED